MGNRALRKKVGEALKAAGYSKKFYSGPKNIGRRYFRARHLHELMYMLSIKPGTIVNDCDAFNHKVTKVNAGFRYWDRGAILLEFGQFEFEDGRLSCGCPGGPMPAMTRDEIEAYMREGFTDENVANSKRDGWWTVNSQKMYDALMKDGRNICDENGIKLPEFCGELIYIKE